MAIHIKTDMLATVVNQQTNPDMFAGSGDGGMHLKAMRSLVGGDIQIISLKKPLIMDGVTYTCMGMNEEGKFSGLKINMVATKIAKEHTSIAHDDVIVGDAVLFEASEVL